MEECLSICLKDQIAALEKDVQVNNPEPKQVATPASAILLHLERIFDDNLGKCSAKLIS